MMGNSAFDWITSLPIAHRAYHDLAAGRAENSMFAFKAAVEAGFSIECDLQVSSTGEPVVYHDPVLGRMTGEAGNVRDHSPRQLSRFRLLETRDGIYTLREHLDAVNGAVPLVLELKGVEGADGGFVEGVANAVKNYAGPFCVMSFDHWVCAQFADVMPDVPRGLTAEGGDEDYQKHMSAMQDYDLQFVSYHVQEANCRFVKDVRRRGLPVISWTISDDETRQKALEFSDQMTFEGFDPRELSDGRL